MKAIFPIRLIGFLALISFLFLYAPIFVVVINASNKSRLGYSWEGFTFEWFVRLFENQMLIGALFNSLQVAFFSSLLGSFLGTAAAISLTRGSIVYKNLFSSLIKLPLILPDLVLGISSLLIFTLLSFPLGIKSIVISHTTFCMCFVALVVSAKLVSLNKSIELAAVDLGASPIQVFFKTTLPQLYTSIFAGMLLAFTLSVDDYVISSFTAGVGGTTLPVRVYSMIKFGVTPEINALSLLLILFSLSMVLIVARLDRRIYLRS